MIIVVVSAVASRSRSLTFEDGLGDEVFDEGAWDGAERCLRGVMGMGGWEMRSRVYTS